MGGSCCAAHGVPMQGEPVICDTAAPEDEAGAEEALGHTLSGASRKPFQVVLTRKGPHWNNIGVVLSPDDSPDYLTIDDINTPSLLGTWNACQPSMRKVRIGDMIKAVNELSSTCDQMLLKIQTIGKGEEIRLLIDPGAEHFDERRNSKNSSGDLDGNAEWLKQKSQGLSANGQKANGPKTLKPKRKVFPELRPHFEVLDISEKSSDDAIRKHYKRLARVWHPDKNPNNREEAKQKFQAINAAYMAIKEKLKL